MEDVFEIAVPYKNGEVIVPARLLVQGYTYKIEATINGSPIWFEPDEERNFRAVFPPDAEASATPPDGALLQAVATALQEALQ